MINTYYLAPRARYDLATEARGIPIYLRFSYKGEEAWLATGEYIKKKEYWHEPSKYVIGGPGFRLINQVIDKYMLDAKERLSQAILEGTGPNIHAFKGKSLASFEDYIYEIAKKKNSKEPADHAKGVIKSMKLFYAKIDKPNTIKKKEMQELLKKLKVPDITSITIQWLRKLQDYMEGVQDLAENTVKGYMMVLSKVMKQAEKEGYITKCPIGPGKYEVPAAGETNPTFLVDEERDSVYEHLLNKRSKFKPSTYMALTYFSLGCFSGLRYSDWAVFDINKHIERDVIILRTKKTGGRVTKTVTHELQDVLNVIKEIGPLTLTYDQVLKELDEIQAILKLDKELTTHVARHSFGYMCASRGVPKEATAYMMAISLDIVENYYHYTGKHMEEQTQKLNIKKPKQQPEQIPEAA